MSGLDLDAVVVRNPAVVETEVDGDIVALDIETATCYGLNRVGSRVWRLLEAPARVGDVHARLLTEFDVDAATCERELLALLADLAEAGLIRRAAPPTGP